MPSNSRLEAESESASEEMELVTSSTTTTPEGAATVTNSPVKTVKKNKSRNESKASSSSHSCALWRSLLAFFAAYRIEPMLFVEGITASISGFCFDEFVFQRFHTRLLLAAAAAAAASTSNHSAAALFDHQHLTNRSSTFVNATTATTPASFHGTCSLTPAEHTHSTNSSGSLAIVAQEMSSQLKFHMSVSITVPSIFISFFVGMNSAQLGRKTIILNHLIIGTFCNVVLALLAYFPQLPDWVFYVASVPGMFDCGFFMSKSIKTLHFNSFFEQKYTHNVIPYNYAHFIFDQYPLKNVYLTMLCGLGLNKMSVNSVKIKFIWID